jgi:hypothetical protein
VPIWCFLSLQLGYNMPHNDFFGENKKNVRLARKKRPGTK